MLLLNGGGIDFRWSRERRDRYNWRKDTVGTRASDIYPRMSCIGETIQMHESDVLEG
jgi:hypothetical protein